MPKILTVAYADPPYVGQAEKHYGAQPDFAGEIDHADLIDNLEARYPDGWALSASSSSLRGLLPLCPPEVRVMPWIKGFAAYKRNVRVAYSWEPLIVKLPQRAEGAAVGRDFTISEVLGENITMKRGLVGAKPDRFCYWLFCTLGLRPHDNFHDLFPGTGAVTAAWMNWRRMGGPHFRQTFTVSNEWV